MASFFRKAWLCFTLLFIWICTVVATGQIRRDPWTKSLILGYVYEGANISTVATVFGTTVKTILRWKQRYETYGTINYEPRSGGPKCKIKNYHIRIIKNILNRKPHIYIYELQRELYRRTGDIFSISQIWIKCKKAKFTKKVITRRFAEANPLAEIAFWNDLTSNNIHINQLVWIDESYICRTSGNRRYGWSLR